MSMRRLMSLVAVGSFVFGLGWMNPAGAQVDPETFKGDANAYRAYKAAREYPQVFKSVFCYCGCDKEDAHHTSLFDCFRDSHGSECGICKAEALMAADLKAKGASIANIEKAIDTSFGAGYKGAPSAAFQAYRAKTKSNWM